MHKRSIAILYLFVLIPALLSGWQLLRYAEKAGLESMIQTRMAMSSLAKLGTDSYYRQVTVEGAWLENVPLCFFPAVRDGKHGCRSLMPLRLADGSLLLVSTGWREDVARHLPCDLRGSATLQGLLLPWPKPHWALPKNDAVSNRWFSLQASELTGQFGAELFPGLLYPGHRMETACGEFLETPVFPRLPAWAHLGYAAMWGAIAAVCALLTVRTHRYARSLFTKS